MNKYIYKYVNKKRTFVGETVQYRKCEDFAFFACYGHKIYIAMFVYGINEDGRTERKLQTMRNEEVGAKERGRVRVEEEGGERRVEKGGGKRRRMKNMEKKKGGRKRGGGEEKGGGGKREKYGEK